MNTERSPLTTTATSTPDAISSRSPSRKKSRAAFDGADAKVEAPKPKQKGKEPLPWLLIGAAVGGVFLCPAARGRDRRGARR